MTKLEVLCGLVGREVVVAIVGDGYTRNHFGVQISICGELERHPDDVAFRVLLSDQTFSYFEEGDVVLVNLEGLIPKIMLSIPVVPKYEVGVMGGE
jgi:hypothetical protein